MPDLVNFNEIILDPLWNINEIYSNLACNDSFKIQPLLDYTSWIMTKRYIFKSNFYDCYHILDIYENRRRKNLINPPCSKLPKIINRNKKWHNVCFCTSLWCLGTASSFWGTKKKGNKRIYVIFPPHSSGTKRVATAFCWTFSVPFNAISVSLTIAILKNNVNTFRVTNKQYYKIIIFKKFLLNETDIFKELLPNTLDIFLENCIKKYIFLSQMWT